MDTKFIIEKIIDELNRNIAYKTFDVEISSSSNDKIIITTEDAWFEPEDYYQLENIIKKNGYIIHYFGAQENNCGNLELKFVIIPQKE